MQIPFSMTPTTPFEPERHLEPLPHWSLLCWSPTSFFKIGLMLHRRHTDLSWDGCVPGEHSTHLISDSKLPSSDLSTKMNICIRNSLLSSSLHRYFYIYHKIWAFVILTFNVICRAAIRDWPIYNRSSNAKPSISCSNCISIWITRTFLNTKK